MMPDLIWLVLCPSPSKVVNGCDLQKRREMKHQFNKSALAKLSKSELFLLKANLKAQFQGAASKPEYAAISYDSMDFQSTPNLCGTCAIPF